jgi:hypothetical protein
MKISMSRTGNPYDNAHMESFFQNPKIREGGTKHLGQREGFLSGWNEQLGLVPPQGSVRSSEPSKSSISDFQVDSSPRAGGGRQYLNEVNHLAIREASKSIKIVHEAAANDPGFARASDIFSVAERIIFLGFGYAQANVNRLRIDMDSSQELFGSVFGFAPKELVELSMRFDDRLGTRYKRQSHK